MQSCRRATYNSSERPSQTTLTAATFTKRKGKILKVCGSLAGGRQSFKLEDRGQQNEMLPSTFIQYFLQYTLVFCHFHTTMDRSVTALDVSRTWWVHGTKPSVTLSRQLVKLSCSINITQQLCFVFIRKPIECQQADKISRLVDWRFPFQYVQIITGKIQEIHG